MSFIYCSLRAEALLWYDVLKCSGIQDTYNSFIAAFLTYYTQALTAHTATVCLHDIKQTAKSPLFLFTQGSIKQLMTSKNVLPRAQLVPTAAAYPAPLVTLGRFAGHANDVEQDAILALFNLGITKAMNHISLQLFVAGLQSSIREK